MKSEKTVIENLLKQTLLLPKNQKKLIQDQLDFLGLVELEKLKQLLKKYISVEKNIFQRTQTRIPTFFSKIKEKIFKMKEINHIKKRKIQINQGLSFIDSELNKILQ